MKRNGKSFFLLAIVCAIGAAQASRFAVVEAADTAFSADMKGWGAFLRGAGSFNLNTAKAAQINADTLRRWKQDIRAAAAEQRLLQAQRETGAKQQIQEARYRLAMQEYQLRVHPTPGEVQNGRALNMLVDDLMDPDISTSDWVTKAVPLPEGMSIKDLIFGFVPASGASNASKALSRGVIALSRLDVKGEKWPTVLKDHALDAEREAYEAAYTKLRDELVSDKFDLKTLIEFDKSLSALAEKVKTAIPNARGFRGEAQKYITELRAATRMFDAETVDYAKEILMDTQNQDAHTVTELVSFMLKYRLRFENAERSPISRVAYDQVYKAMRQQADLFGIKPPDPPAAPGAKAPPAAPGGAVAKAGNAGGWVPLFNGKDLSGWHQPEPKHGTWRVADGVLIGRGGGVRGQRGALVSDRRDFTDFRLRLEITPGQGVARAILRAPVGATKIEGYDVALTTFIDTDKQVTNAGSIRRVVGPWDIRARNTALLDGPYRVEIDVSGRKITAFVEGVKTAEYTDPDNLYPSGQIRFDCGINDELRFRRIDIKE